MSLFVGRRGTDCVRIGALNVRRNWQHWITTNSLYVKLKLFVQNTRLLIKQASSKTYPGSAWLMLIIFPSLRCSEVVWCNLATTFAVLRLRALCVVWVSPLTRRIEAIFRSQTGSHRDQRPVSTHMLIWWDFSEWYWLLNIFYRGLVVKERSKSGAVANTHVTSHCYPVLPHAWATATTFFAHLVNI